MLIVCIQHDEGKNFNNLVFTVQEKRQYVSRCIQNNLIRTVRRIIYAKVVTNPPARIIILRFVGIYTFRCSPKNISECGSCPLPRQLVQQLIHACRSVYKGPLTEAVIDLRIF